VPRAIRAAVILALVCAWACAPARPRDYELRGQILEIDTQNGVVTIRHGDIKGFMPAMTMPFKVKDKGLLKSRRPGDFVTGTLSVTDADVYLTRLDVTGHGEVAHVGNRPPAIADILQPGSAVPDARLIDATGRAFALSSLRGSVVALTFVYTRCPLPQFCPLMDRQFAAVLARIRNDARLRGLVRLLSISFDPEYDIPAVLDAHARQAGADGTLWRFATADRATIDAFAPRFGMVVVRDNGGAITHNLRTAIIDRQGRLVKIYDGNDWTADELVADLVKTAGT
jgi:protein SCO1/2